MKKARAILLAVMVVVVLGWSANVSAGMWWWPPTGETLIEPANPTSSDVVTITVCGDWPDSCIPYDSTVRTEGNSIYFDVIWEPEQLCLDVISAWSQMQSVGPLSPGTYTVYAALAGDRGGYAQVGEFVVTGGGGEPPPPGSGSGRWSEPVPVDEVNTDLQEYKPFLSYDGLTIYFSRRVSNIARIYDAVREAPSGPFGAPREIMSSSYPVIGCWVSPDNLRMYYHNELLSAWLLKVSERASANDPWPVGTNISELNALGDIHTHSLTADELIIVFSSPRIPGGAGYYDLWTASRPDRSSAFGNVRELSEINTSLGELGPTITPDGLTLYFTRIGTETVESFRATRESLEEPFGNIQSLADIGMPDASLSLSSDGSAAYFCLGGDIYVSYLEEDDAGLVAHWRFDEGEGLIAYDSAGDNDGVVFGADWIDGQIGGALDFDGVDDCVGLPDNSPVWLPEYDFTCSVWVYFDAPASVAGQEILLDLNCTASSDPTNDNGCTVLRKDSGEAFFGMTTITDVEQKLYSNQFFTEGEWYHIVALRGGTNQAMYVNGNLDSSRICSASRIDYTGGSYDDDGVSIGRWTTVSNPNGLYYLNGKIDDVRIYGRALSAEEVLGLYEEVPLPPEAKVYHVDGDAGSDLNDGLSRGTAFATIQKGIDSSIDGGEVLVWPGVYSEAINFLGKAITVRSAGDAAVIEAAGMDAVTFHSGERAGSVIRNFVIRNSSLAISANYGSSPTIGNLTIVDNDFGIATCEGSEPTISNCILWNNRDGDLLRCEARYSWVQQELELNPDDPNTGLLSHWEFDEGAGLIAYDSAGSNDAVVLGPEWVSGQIGGALSFDGVDDYVALPDNDPVWLPQNDFTLSAWVCFDRAPAAAPGETFLDLNFADSGDPSNEFGCAVSRLAGTGQVAFGMTTLTNTDEDICSDEALLEAKWYHVVAIRSGTTQAIYVNGRLDNSRACSPDPIDFVGDYDDDKVNIGRVTDGAAQYHVQGEIDDVRIYDRALSGEEILQLYAPVASIDPLFADAAGGDYHLLSERGRYWPAHDIWVLDDVTSPCIDGGDPAVDPSGEPMPNGGAINIGAYGGTGQAGMSEWPIASDYNRDGKSNFQDFVTFCEEWLITLPWAQ